MSLKSFISSRRFLVNTGIMLGTTIVLLWLTFKFLDVYTRHGETFVVPDFSGMTPSEITDHPDHELFKFEILDSIYDNSRPGGTIIAQEPLPGMEVKKSRTVHLTVISKRPEMIEIPDLGNTLRQARSQIQAYGLELGKVKEVYSKYPGLLMKIYYQGQEVKPGDKVLRGARIDLDVGSGDDLLADSLAGDFVPTEIGIIETE